MLKDKRPHCTYSMYRGYKSKEEERSKWLPVSSTLTQAACFATGDDSTAS